MFLKHCSCYLSPHTTCYHNYITHPKNRFHGLHLIWRKFHCLISMVMNAQSLPQYPAGSTRTWDGAQIAQCPRGQKHVSEKANCKDLTMETLASVHGSGQAALGGPMPCFRRARWPPKVPFNLNNSVVILHNYILGKHQYSFNKLACCWMVRNN